MKVRGFSDENYFEEILVSKAANRHSYCKFKQRVAEENLAAYQNSIGKNIGVELDNGRPIFFGEVTEILIERTYRGSYAEIKAVSSSLKTDEVKETRIFQNPEKTFGEVFKLKNCSPEVEDKLAAQKCKEIILQDAETNFEFVKRLAAWQGRRVWVMDTVNKLQVGTCSDESTNKISQEEIIRLKVGRRGKIQTAELVTAKYFELGRILKLGDVPGKFLIVGLEAYQERGVDRIRFELEEMQNSEPSELITPPAKLTAKVTDISDDKNFGRLRVQFDVEDKAADKIWLAYRTPYSGIIFMPEVGEAVEVFYKNGEAYVDSTLRTKPLDDEFKNVKDKFLGNNRKQRIFFREKSLEIKSADTSIFLDDKKIVLSVGENKIVMDEAGISLKTGGAFKSDVAKDFASKVGGNIKVDGKDISLNSGGKFESAASGAAKIKGNSVNVEADGATKIKGSSVKVDSSDIKLG